MKKIILLAIMAVVFCACSYEVYFGFYVINDTGKRVELVFREPMTESKIYDDVSIHISGEGMVNQHDRMILLPGDRQLIRTMYSPSDSEAVRKKIEREGLEVYPELTFDVYIDGVKVDKSYMQLSKWKHRRGNKSRNNPEEKYTLMLGEDGDIIPDTLIPKKSVR